MTHYKRIPKSDQRIASIFKDATTSRYRFFDCAPFPECKPWGPTYRTKADAMRAALREGFTHAIGDGTYWGHRVRRIPFS